MTTLYTAWYRHFWSNRRGLGSLPWSDAPPLTLAERQRVARSVAQFQLGEWARGRGLLRRAAAHPALAADPWFVPALRLFIAEEQRHSALLGRFLDREHIPRLDRQWVDAVFRRLRKLAGLELCAVVLATAEVLAIPFYQALRDATGSPLLRALCRRILCDEAAHLQYQALTIGLARQARPVWAQRLSSAAHALLFRVTALVLWQQHRGVFHGAGWRFSRFLLEASSEFARLQAGIDTVARGGQCFTAWREARLTE